MINLIDADRHVVEPFSMWSQYVDVDVFRRFPVSLTTHQTTVDGQPLQLAQMMINGLAVNDKWTIEHQIAVATSTRHCEMEQRCAAHPITQLDAMDIAGFEMAYLYPGFAGYIVNHAQLPDTVSLAFADGYNRWLKDYVEVAPERLRPIGLISRHNPATMVEQLQKIRQWGWTCVTLRPEVINGRSVGDKDYHAFYQACAEHNIAVVFHGGAHLNGSTVGAARFKSRFALLASAHPMELQLAFLSLLESGVLAANPRLKIGLLEGGCSWVAHWLWRLDNICYPEFPKLVADVIRKPPSQYFKQHCWVNVEPGEPGIDQVIEMIGHERLVFGSDYPHFDHVGVTPECLLAKCGELSQAQRQAIFQQNPLDLYQG